MLIKHFETKLYTHFKDFFSRNGYELLLDKKQFRKVTQNGFMNIVFSISEINSAVFLVEVNFGSRNNQIEQIAQQFLNNFLEYRNDANTLITNIGRFSNVKYFQFRIEEMQDLESFAEQIFEFFTSIGFSFLEASTNLRTIEKILNEKPSQACKYVYNQVHRAYKGAIVARLLYKKNFSSLIKTYRNYVEKHGTEQEISNFELLVAFLTYYSPN